MYDKMTGVLCEKDVYTLGGILRKVLVRDR